MKHVDRSQEMPLFADLQLADPEVILAHFITADNHLDAFDIDFTLKPTVKLILVPEVLYHFLCENALQHIIHIDGLIIFIIQNEAVAHIVRKTHKRPILQFDIRIIIDEEKYDDTDRCQYDAEYPDGPVVFLRKEFQNSIKQFKYDNGPEFASEASGYMITADKSCNYDQNGIDK